MKPNRRTTGVITRRILSWKPFRIDPAVMFDPDYRDLMRGQGALQLRDRWPLSGAGAHNGVGNLLQTCGMNASTAASA
jgi:hypothetical protein